MREKFVVVNLPRLVMDVYLCQVDESEDVGNWTVSWLEQQGEKLGEYTISKEYEERMVTRFSTREEALASPDADIDQGENDGTQETDL